MPSDFIAHICTRLARVGLTFAAATIATHTSAADYARTEAWVSTAIRFVQWPAEVAALSRAILLCHPVGEMRGLPLQGKTVRGVAISIAAVSSPRETGPCQAFITESTDREKNALWLGSFHNRPVLSIGFSADFCIDGGVICPPRADFRGAHYAVNYAVAARTGLSVSSHLPAHDVTGYALPRKIAR